MKMSNLGKISEKIADETISTIKAHQPSVPYLFYGYMLKLIGSCLLIISFGTQALTMTTQDKANQTLVAELSKKMDYIWEFLGDAQGKSANSESTNSIMEKYKQLGASLPLLSGLKETYNYVNTQTQTFYILGTFLLVIGSMLEMIHNYKKEKANLLKKS